MKNNTSIDKSTIERQVSTLLDNYGYSQEKDDYVNIIDFVKKLGFIVGNAEMSDNEDGFLIVHPEDSLNDAPDLPNDKIIGVNETRTLNFKRFIIAHEFAHYVLHYKMGETYFHRENRKGKGPDENEADYFAASLLMPSGSFKRLYKDLKDKGLNRNLICLQLSSIFKVPAESVSRRIDELFESTEVSANV